MKILIEKNERQFKAIEDIYKSEVVVTLDDGFILTITVGKPKNLEYLIKKDKINFYGLSLPWIIVQKLAKKIIQEAIKV